MYGGDALNGNRFKFIKRNIWRLEFKKQEYNTMYKYYKGETDAISNYKMVTKRSNNKINTNFLKSLLMKRSLILL